MIPNRLAGFVAGMLLCLSATGFQRALEFLVNVSVSIGQRAALFAGFALVPILFLLLAWKYFCGPPRPWVHSCAFVILALYALSVGVRLLSVLRVAGLQGAAVGLSIGMLVELAIGVLLIA